MTLDNITKEQFDLYKKVQKKEKELQVHTSEKRKNRFIAMVSGGITPFATLTTIEYSGVVSCGSTTFGYLMTLACGVTCCLCVVLYLGNSKTINSLEKEIEQLKSEPDYKPLLGEE